ncbi:MAG: flagellin [Anaerolineae bacterium]|nr:flagellin [Anaerolineae bacterium]
MDKAIITILMIVASVVAAVLVFNAAYPAIVQGNGAVLSMKSRIDERLRSQIEVIHACKSADYVDVALVWVKNVGSVPIKAVERCDVFFGPEGRFTRIPYGSGDPHWEYAVENAPYWEPTATLRVVVDVDYSIAPGERYFFKMVTPSGVSDEFYFSTSR